jgi:hypothetical protein
MCHTLVVGLVFLILTGFSSGPMLIAQVAPGKTGQTEVSVSWLGLTPGGNVLTNSNRVDFASDLGIHRMQSQAGLWFATKRNRSGLFVEFIPYRFSGDRTITRSFRFGGVTYPVNERIIATASLNYFSAGYQRSFVDRPSLELALQAGAVYIGVRARASSPSIGSADVNRDVPFPLVGLGTRYSPSEKSRFSIRGQARGMTFGSYGKYIDVAGAVGFKLSRHVDIDAGYRLIDGEGHHATRGAELRFHGPTVALRVHDR